MTNPSYFRKPEKRIEPSSFIMENHYYNFTLLHIKVNINKQGV